VIPAAKLEGVRLHDLRHTVGSVGAGAGLSMLMIGTVLGHKQVSTTERYSHVARGPLHEAADRISSEIAATMNGKTAKVTKMPARRRKAAKA
jgi:site-specific recombinase XerD